MHIKYNRDQKRNILVSRNLLLVKSEQPQKYCFQVARHWFLSRLSGIYSSTPHFHWRTTLLSGYSLLRLLLKVASPSLTKPGQMFLSWYLNLQKSSKKIETGWNSFIPGVALRQNYWEALGPRPPNLPCVLPIYEPCSINVLLFCEPSDNFLINCYVELGRGWSWCLWLQDSNYKPGVQEKVSGPSGETGRNK